MKLNQLEKLPEGSFYVIVNGCLVEDWKKLDDTTTFHVVPRVLGGKGGFGSLLRSFGSQFYKSTNQDMCRDLTGRRLKDVKEEEKLKKYITKANEREEARRKKEQEKYEKLKRLTDKGAASASGATFDDLDYGRTKQEISDKTEEAVLIGLKVSAQKVKSDKDDDDQPGTSTAAATSSRKRPGASTAAASTAKKAKTHDMWLGMDEIDDEDLSGEEASPALEVATKQ